MFRDVECLLRPKVIAIVGASDSSRGGWAQEIYDNLGHCGFPAKLYLVNPKRKRAVGPAGLSEFRRRSRSASISRSPSFPRPSIPDTLAEAAAHGLKCALIYAAQFGEGGDPEGQARAQALQTALRQARASHLRPELHGLAGAAREAPALSGQARARAAPGSVGVVFQSGGTFQFWLQQASLRGLDFSYAVSSGNELDLDLADYINFLVDDEHTKIIACLVEGIRRPQAFMAAAEKALAARKPIVLVKLGRSERGKAAAASHTGAIAGDDAVFDAVCRKYGIVRCPSLDDLIETCLAFTQGRLPKGPRIAMACYSGGAKGLILDYASDEGAEMAPLTPETKSKLPGMIDPGLAAENPLDVGPTVGVQAAKFAEICKVVCADPTVDLVTVQGLMPVNPDDPLQPRAAAGASRLRPTSRCWRSAASRRTHPRSSRKFQSETGVPFIQGLPETVRALQGLVRYAAALRRGVARAARAARRAPKLDGAALRRAARGARADAAAQRACARRPTKPRRKPPRSDFRSR